MYRNSKSLNRIVSTLDSQLRELPNFLVITKDIDVASRSWISDIDYVAIPNENLDPVRALALLDLACNCLRDAQIALRDQGEHVVSFFSFRAQELMRGLGESNIGPEHRIEAVHSLFFASRQSYLELEDSAVATYFLTHGRFIAGNQGDAERLLAELRVFRAPEPHIKECLFRLTEAFVNWRTNVNVSEEVLSRHALRMIKSVVFICVDHCNPGSSLSTSLSWNALSSLGGQIPEQLVAIVRFVTELTKRVHIPSVDLYQAFEDVFMFVCKLA